MLPAITGEGLPRRAHVSVPAPPASVTSETYEDIDDGVSVLSSVGSVDTVAVDENACTVELPPPVVAMPSHPSEALMEKSPLAEGRSIGERMSSFSRICAELSIVP